jgi:hypothetical protein
MEQVREVIQAGGTGCVPAIPLQKTAADLGRPGNLKEGDVILFRNGIRSKWMNEIVRRVQYARLPLDFPALSNAGDKKAVYLRHLAASFTHAGVVSCMAHTDQGPLCVGEMTLPMARVIPWTRKEGQQILVREWATINGEGLWSAPHRVRLQGVARGARIDRDLRVPYGFRELAAYVMNWGIFRSATRDVCSGRVIYWGRYAGFVSGEPPSRWYPARIFLDSDYWLTRERYEVIG